MSLDRQPGGDASETTGPKRLNPANILFTTIFLIIIFCQTFYWLFANRLEPILLGMPFGMFTITVLILLEFLCLVILYRLQNK